ncbi:trypsin-like serine peptidase [Elioraea sp.]|jgi:glutamyl endopeptidase|uniref:trypsin-like serine peptidase n=1 Tax=Elioraea sp. TaxID=2185103 RepID=UPI003F7198B0
MDLELRWREVEAAIEAENAKPAPEDGHAPVSGAGVGERETDTLTRPEFGAAGAAAETMAEVYTEAPGGATVAEVEGQDVGAESAMPPPVMPEIVHGTDDRVRVNNTTAYPYRTICHLEITAANGRSYIGSGAFIGPRVVLTAGHCIYIHADGGWARSVRVIPGRNGSSKPYGEAVGTNYRSVKGWTQSRNSDYDYGVIILPTALGNTVGWMGLADLAFTSLMGLNVNNSGYPGDKPYGTQWWNSNNILAVTGRRLYYRIDTMGGQSGSPVWRFKDGNRHIVGIHTTGGTFNGATRVNEDVFKNLVAWKGL